MPYQQVTLAQLDTQLSEKTDGSRFWSSAERLTALNEALRVWNLLTGMWKRRVLLQTVANQVYYDLPSTLVYNLRADYIDQPVELGSIGDMDYGKPGWEAQTTATSGAPSRPSIFMPVGLTRIAIWPADAVGGFDLVIDGVRSTPVLVNPGDFIDLGQAEHLAILNYALHYLAFKEGGQRFAATQSHFQSFLRAAADQNARLKASTYFRRALGLDDNRGRRPMKLPVEAQLPEAPNG